MSIVNSAPTAVAARTTPLWQRATNSVELKPASLPSPGLAHRRESDDDISTTIGCSDAEDGVSTLSRSSSTCELKQVISRDAMLFHRSRLTLIKDGDCSRGLHCRQIAKSAPVPAAKVTPAPVGFVPPPGLEMLNGAALSIPVYSPPLFRKELMAILKDLSTDRNVARAVRRVRAQGVPHERQAAEFADVITFVLEESRGAARRSYVALLAGLASSVFEKKQCIAGLSIFFNTIYPDLLAEVPKLNKLVHTELFTTLSSAFAAEELRPFVSMVKA